jgi:putative methyltransferase (TIGR01177 family)
LKNKALVLLSGEESTIPAAEARALFRTYDPGAEFSQPEPRILIVESTADPDSVARRIAFARRVGALIGDAREAADLVKGLRIRFRRFTLDGAGARDSGPGNLLNGVDAEVDLGNPDFEYTQVSGRAVYLCLTRPGLMLQGWAERRPRTRAFFHPSAIFPKLSRALVNLSVCKEGETLLDPFAGTGSIPIEAAQVGLRAVAIDRARRMAEGSFSNMKRFGQDWTGIIRCDSLHLPFASVDGIVSDVPYGRASSTLGLAAGEVVDAFLEEAAVVLRPGRRLVLMHPKTVDAKSGRGFSTEEEHDLYVHKKLTRTITVLRRG